MSIAKKILLSLVVLIGLLGVSIALLVHYSLPVYKNSNQSLANIENALSTPDTLILASIDVNYLRKLHNKLYGTAKLPDLLPEPVQGSSVYSVLEQALMQQPDSISFVSASVYKKPDNPLSVVLVAGGNFNVDSFISFLKTKAQAQPHEQIKNAWTIQMQDVDTCNMSSKITVIVSGQSIIVMDTVDQQLFARLENVTPATRDLSLWKEFRKSRFMALAAFIPKEIPKQGINPLVGMTAQQAKQKFGEFNEIYLGAASKAIPPGGSLSVWMAAQNQAIAAEKAASWQSELAASRKSWEKSLPSMAAMHDHAKIVNRGHLIQADIKLDKKLTDDLRKLPAELLGLIFSGFGGDMKVSQGSQPAPTEKIDSNPRKFIDQVNIASLPPYDAHATFSEPADILSGPFGIQLAGMRLTSGNPRLLEMDIKTIANNLPNISDNPESAIALSINSVRDKNGNEILREEPCGQDRNLLAAHPAFTFGGGPISATKRIRLREHAKISDVASVKGSVKLDLPGRIEYISMPNPKDGDFLEKDGLRIEITRIDSGSVSYRSSGKIDKLLHLRSKNAKGEYLAKGGSMSTGSILGGGKSTTVDFHGNIASLEFVLASATISKSYPFELNDIYLRGKDEWTLDKPLVYEIYNKQEIKRNFQQQAVTPKRFQQPVISKAVGPAMLDLVRASAFQNMKFGFSIYVPQFKSFNGSLSAIELEIQKFTMPDGSTHQAAQGMSGWRVAVPLEKSGMDDYLSGWADVETDIPVKDNKFSSISGNLLLNTPLAFESKTLEKPEVGSQTGTICGPILISEITRSAIALEGRGDPACLYAVRAISSGGKDLRIMSSKYLPMQQAWKLQLSYKGLPNSLELLMVKKSESLRYPFILNASEGMVAK